MNRDSTNCLLKWREMMKHSVVFNNVTKKYKMYRNTKDRLKGVVAPNRYGEDFYAVRNVSFTADPGDTIGIVGVNGAGKSTLSNLIAGVISQTSGEITIKGKAAIIAIASGLDNELSGRDNIEYKCLMLGFKKDEIRELIPEIIDFADIGNFIDQPVKSYSSGMKSRLGFAISVNVDPDVLIIDEALSVGDQTFKEKCYDKMEEFKKKGKTIFFVSHSIREIKNFCQKVLWLEAGEVRAYGTKKEVIPQYRAFLKEFKALSDEEKRNFRQRVIEQRSQVQEVAESKDNDLQQPIPRNSSRIQRNKKNLFFRSIKVRVIILLLLISAIGVAAYVGKPWEMFLSHEGEQTQTSSRDNTETVPDKDGVPETEEESEEDIRYVMVEVASIRSGPSLDSELIDYAGFGDTYVIEETEENVSDDIEWLKFAGTTSEKDGWISGNVMEEITESLNDAKIAEKLEALIGSHPILEKISTMTEDGPPGGDIFGEYESANENEKGEVSISVSDTSKTDMIDELGDPQIEVKNKLLYHGTTFDFIFSLENGRVQELIIVENKENDI